MAKRRVKSTSMKLTKSERKAISTVKKVVTKLEALKKKQTAELKATEHKLRELK